MIAHAKARYLRVPPRKAQQVIDLIRGKDVVTSLSILTHVNKRSTEYISKLLTSAISNAKKKGLSEDQLFISKIVADPGPMWKRFRAASFGRATPILKRTTHLTIELDLKVK
ncbi:MAG: 50S ribosomal protein L22 [Omnitrophica WOR_2 bacterium GWA2_47_8]|nr:MAG: 50S ribosomal protein L22 [Omnitrophica WOR_2 bacterium GWA2_47_8]